MNKTPYSIAQAERRKNNSLDHEKVHQGKNLELEVVSKTRAAAQRSHLEGGKREDKPMKILDRKSWACKSWDYFPRRPIG